MISKKRMLEILEAIRISIEQQDTDLLVQEMVELEKEIEEDGPISEQPEPPS